jgi:hypothetical protein
MFEPKHALDGRLANARLGRTKLVTTHVELLGDTLVRQRERLAVPTPRRVKLDELRVTVASKANKHAVDVLCRDVCFDRYIQLGPI